MVVNYLHANNIVYRDFKPENILFSKSKTDIIKVVDFGTATRFKRGVPLTEQFGSPYYIAPEVIKMNYNEKCDEWSIGVILFTMLMRRQPFDGKTDQDVINNILFKPINFHHTEFNKISSHCLDLMKQLLFKDANSRIDGDRAFKHPFLSIYGLEQSDRKDIRQALQNFRTYPEKGVLSKATIDWMIHNLVSHD